jgi:hypothetical protein
LNSIVEMLISMPADHQEKHVDQRVTVQNDWGDDEQNDGVHHRGNA